MRSFRSKPVGWQGESYRHYLAAKGFSTAKKYYAYQPQTGIGRFLQRANAAKEYREKRVVAEADEPYREQLRIERKAVATPLTAEEEVIRQEWLEKIGRVQSIEDVARAKTNTLAAAQTWDAKIGDDFLKRKSYEVEVLKEQIDTSKESDVDPALIYRMDVDLKDKEKELEKHKEAVRVAKIGESVPVSARRLLGKQVQEVMLQ